MTGAGQVFVARCEPCSLVRLDACSSVPAAAGSQGDVVVIQNYPGGDVNGHIALYDGTRWVSDFKQRDIWAGPGYRANQPPLQVYRP